MEYAPDQLAPRERYKVLASFVLPRPIAWVTSMSPAGVVNAAPYSFFNVFCEEPPLCMFAVNKRAGLPIGRAPRANAVKDAIGTGAAGAKRPGQRRARRYSRPLRTNTLDRG